MAKTRMLVGDKDAIVAAIIQHKFGPVYAALRVEEAALAAEVYDCMYDKQAQAWMAKAPLGSLPTSASISVNAGGYRLELKLAQQRSFFEKHTRYDGRFNLPSGDLTDRIRNREEREDTAGKEKSALRYKTSSAVNQFRTFDDLIAAWPEAEAIIKPLWGSQPNLSPSLPAVLLKDLSAALDLPPEAIAA